MNTINAFLYVWGAAIIVNQLYSLSLLITGTIMGGKPHVYGVFFGPKLFQFKIGQVLVRVHAFPFDSYVKFGNEFKILSLWWQTLINASGFCFLVLLAVLIFGIDEGIWKIIRGFSQFISVIFSPFSYGIVIFSSLADYAGKEPFIASIGLLASKYAAFALLPFWALGGFISRLILKKLIPTSENATQTIQLLVSLLVVAVWLASFINYLGSVIMLAPENGRMSFLILNSNQIDIILALICLIISVVLGTWRSDCIFWQKRVPLNCPRSWKLYYVRLLSFIIVLFSSFWFSFIAASELKIKTNTLEWWAVLLTIWLTLWLILKGIGYHKAKKRYDVFSGKLVKKYGHTCGLK
jgi:predicted membrane protein